MSDQKSSKAADDVVGYHRPPRALQFAPGEGGHPKERPKDSPPVGAFVQDIIRQQIAAKAIPTICVTELSDELIRAIGVAASKLPEVAP
jgi:hypothetical protein